MGAMTTIGPMASALYNRPSAPTAIAPATAPWARASAFGRAWVSTPTATSVAASPTVWETSSTHAADTTLEAAPPRKSDAP